MKQHIVPVHDFWIMRLSKNCGNLVPFEADNFFQYGGIVICKSHAQNLGAAPDFNYGAPGKDALDTGYAAGQQAGAMICQRVCGAIVDLDQASGI